MSNTMQPLCISKYRVSGAFYFNLTTTPEPPVYPQRGVKSVVAPLFSFTLDNQKWERLDIFNPYSDIRF